MITLLNILSSSLKEVAVSEGLNSRCSNVISVVDKYGLDGKTGRCVVCMYMPAYVCFIE
jgi:hypothetical protein